jgi:GrpB-like predicted nucleotidyltransferase (UPF0157 family)
MSRSSRPGSVRHVSVSAAAQRRLLTGDDTWAPHCTFIVRDWRRANPAERDRYAAINRRAASGE